jgi:8-oxo-dGTP diphosphatase
MFLKTSCTHARKTPKKVDDTLTMPKKLADFKVGVDNVIFSVDTDQNRLLVLLVMRHGEPFTGYWSLPGTLVRQGESLEDAAYRVLSEKIHVNNLYLEQLYTFGGPNRDPREQEGPVRCALPIGELFCPGAV